MRKGKPSTIELVGGHGFQVRNDRAELAVRVDGAEQVLYFATQDCQLRASDEALLSATLLACMAARYDYPEPLTLDPQFQEALPSIQDYYRACEPESGNVAIPLAPEPMDAPAEPATGVGTLFSGGLDSFYTLLKHQDEITHLCLIVGMDIPLDDVEYRAGVVGLIREVGRRLGKEVIVMETNITPFLLTFNAPLMAYGALLRTTAMLPDGFGKFYIPATYFAPHLGPDGTHPVLDPLWDTGRLRFVHDGCHMTRFRKTEYVSRYPVTYDTLRVCWRSHAGTHNCCECEKCVRTMSHLQALDRLDRYSVFPRPLDLTRYPDPGPTPLALKDYYTPVQHYLRDTGKHPQLLKYLEGIMFPPLWRQYYPEYRKWRKLIKRSVRDYLRKALRFTGSNGADAGRGAA
jgi:hypothetical protein